MNQLNKSQNKLKLAFKKNRNIIASILVGCGVLSSTTLVVSMPAGGGGGTFSYTCVSAQFPKRDTRAVTNTHNSRIEPCKLDSPQLEDGVPVFHYTVSSISNSITVDTSDVCYVNDPDNPKNVLGGTINGYYDLEDWSEVATKGNTNGTAFNYDLDGISLTPDVSVTLFLTAGHNYDPNCKTPVGNETYTIYSSANNPKNGYSGIRVYFYLSGDLSLSGNKTITHNNANNANPEISDRDSNGIKDGNPGDFRIYGNPEDLKNTTADQTIKWSGNTTTNAFIYALDANCGINGGGNGSGIYGAVWCKSWDMSNSNASGAKITVPSNLIANLGSDFSNAGLQRVSSGGRESYIREAVE